MELMAHLAEVEPPQEQGKSGHWPCGRPNRAWDEERRCYDEAGYYSGTAYVAHKALREALAAFVGEMA